MRDLAEQIGELLTGRELTLALAESCTGGLISHQVTNVSGSSAYFLGGVVSYANSAKMGILGVPEETLMEHGAVSEPTAFAMANGARKLFGSDVAVAVTGIAGPAGGTEEKPVGLVYVALVAEEARECERHVFDGGRLEVKRRTARAALELLRRYLAEAP